MRTDHEIVARGSEPEDGMLVLGSGIDETAVKAYSGDFPVVAARQVLVGRHDHVAWNSFSIFLADHVVKLAIGNEVHARESGGVRCDGTDKTDRSVPCFRVIGK